MWIRDRWYWKGVFHPVNIGFKIEDFIRWITFRVYKPFITATICGVWEEYCETKEFNRRNRSGSMR